MKRVVRILVGLVALAGAIAWTGFVNKLSRWRGPMAGAGDGAGTASPSGGDELLSALLIGVIWLVPILILAAIVWGVFRATRSKQQSPN
jgi:hypothetical protein